MAKETTHRMRLACPKCGGPARITESRRNTKDNEMYRRNVCPDCGHGFFSVEYEIEDQDAFAKQWSKYHNKHYAPVTYEERRVGRLTLDGKTHTYAEWSEITGLTPNTIRRRLYRGWTVEDALTIPNTRQPKRGDTLKGWSNFCTKGTK